ERPVARSIGRSRALQNAIKINVPGVTWRQLRRQDGDCSAGGIHKGGGGDKAAKVCDVGVREEGTPRHPSTCPTREDAAIDCRARGGGEKAGKSSIGVGGEACRGATRDGDRC